MAGFFSRIWRVFKGQAHSGADALEDATFESTVKQTVRDMEEELNNVIRASAQAMSNHNRLEAEYNRYVEHSKDWKAKAVKALKAGKEDLAKKALIKKGDCDRQIAALQTSVEEANNVRAKLKSQVETLKRKIDEARRNASTMIARKNAASAQKKVAQVLAGVSETDNAFAALKRMEDSVERDEAMAKAYEDLSTDPDGELAKEFEKLDASTADADLEALKAELSGEPTTAEEDEELAKLEKELNTEASAPAKAEVAGEEKK